MPRIRTLKPEFWQDEKLALLDPTTRLVFLGLVSLADDAGRLLDNVKFLDGQIFPFTDDTCADALTILAKLSRVLRYTAASGQNLIQIVGWDRHQKVAHPSSYVLPAPPKDVWLQKPEEQAVTQPVAKSSRKSRETRARTSRNTRDPILDHGPTTYDLGPCVAPDGASASSEANWVAAAADAWSKEIGQVAHGRLGRVLKPAVDTHGIDAVLAAIPRYAQSTKGKARKPEWFVEDVVRFLGSETPAPHELVDHDGVLTAAGKQFLGDTL